MPLRNSLRFERSHDRSAPRKFWKGDSQVTTEHRDNFAWEGFCLKLMSWKRNEFDEENSLRSDKCGLMWLIGGKNTASQNSTAVTPADTHDQKIPKTRCQRRTFVKEDSTDNEEQGAFRPQPRAPLGFSQDSTSGVFYGAKFAALAHQTDPMLYLPVTREGFDSRYKPIRSVYFYLKLKTACARSKRNSLSSEIVESAMNSQ